MAGGKRHEDEEKGYRESLFSMGKESKMKPDKFIITMSDRPQAKRE